MVSSFPLHQSGGILNFKEGLGLPETEITAGLGRAKTEDRLKTRNRDKAGERKSFQGDATCFANLVGELNRPDECRKALSTVDPRFSEALRLLS